MAAQKHRATAHVAAVADEPGKAPAHENRGAGP
jgi:hypothetical protein